MNKEEVLMKVIAPAVYQLADDESFRVRIDCVGTAYLALGDVNGFVLPFSDKQHEVTVTPALLRGPHSVNHVFLHVVYQQGATPQAEYSIRVLDQQGTPMDEMGSKLNPKRALPYRNDFDLRVEVL
jgi:hypothetical protein